MDLTTLLSLLAERPAYRRLILALGQAEWADRATVPEAARPYLLAALARDLGHPVLVLTARPENARTLQEQLRNWCPAARVLFFPEPEVLPYERITADAATEMERVRTLSVLACADEVATGQSAPLLIAAAPALMSFTAPPGDFRKSCHQVTVGMTLSPLDLLSRWQAMGYEAESLVEIPGTMSHRGGIVDIFPPTGELPARLEFFGDTIESIRLFDPGSQRSQQEIKSVSVGPATELLAVLQQGREEVARVLRGLDLSGCREEVREEIGQEIAGMEERQRPRHPRFYAPLFNRSSLLDYLPEDAVVILDEPLVLEQAVAALDMEAQQLAAGALRSGEIPRNYPRPYLDWTELAPRLEQRRRLEITSFDTGEEALRFDFRTAPNFTGQLGVFLEQAAELRRTGKRVIIASNQAGRLSELLAEKDIIAAPVEEIRQLPPPGSVTLLKGSLAEGWILSPDTCLYTDAELFGFVKQRRLAKKRPVPRHKLFVDITPGDYAVHVEHGIGKFLDVVTLHTAGVKKEYLVLQYAAGDRLYVPTDQIDRVSRYIGAGDRPPGLSRLGTQEWRRTKKRVQEAAEELAQELLGLYAHREVAPGFAFSGDTVWQQELEASFPYLETPDQATAEHDVKEDMEKPKPMDRLVCGDVGYGKTEVAIRAAFKAVMDGKQVAVLVPTTVLAEQHHATFRERMNAFPVRIEALSRFQPPREQDTIIEALAQGKVDIVIGTHRLLQKDVAFKDLGLLVIDEEQRFGVVHKEYLKKLRGEIDVLTLSATPIPRTLHMSLVGVRDMSTMETPPEERLPIKTYVSADNPRLIREAIVRELERNGQVFFVHNRVQSIEGVAAELRELVPEAEFAVAHGRMPPETLEAVMADFARGKADVLVCTTIIESGLDMPNVNSMIVHQADRLGLAQLYQLRGRVGRGANLAYAYFLYEGGRHLTPAAQKRLRTIFEATELGAGFDIAMKDLEIRGAGNLLGAKQSGHISAVGFSLYCRLLSDAVETQKARLAGGKEVSRRLPPPAIDLPLAAYIPEETVADINTRLELYQQLAKIGAEVSIDEFARDFTDRFGMLPAAVSNLLFVIRIKLLGTKAGVESIGTEDSQIVLRLFPGMRFTEKQRALSLPAGVNLGVSQVRLDRKRPGKSWEGVLETLVRQLAETSAP
ncbi:MAG: transcription-repair coupling factor [Chloroflexota bacterium]